MNHIAESLMFLGIILLFIFFKGTPDIADSIIYGQGSPILNEIRLSNPDCVICIYEDSQTQ